MTVQSHAEPAPRTPLAAELRRQERTQTWLAEQLGITRGDASDYCTGKHVPRAARRERIAEILDVDVDVVFPGHRAAQQWAGEQAA